MSFKSGVITILLRLFFPIFLIVIDSNPRFIILHIGAYNSPTRQCRAVAVHILVNELN